jgi:hypothetical protein
MRYPIVLHWQKLMLGCCLEGIRSEEVLQSRMSLLLEGLLLSNASSCIHFWIC